MNWWNKISNVGLENSNDIHHVRHVHILNRILFLSCFFIGLYIPINIILGNYFFFAVQTFFFVCISIAYWFNHKKWFRFSTYYIFFFIILNILFALVMHNNAGTEYLLIPSSIAPFIIFRRINDSLIMLVFFMIACIVGLTLQQYITPLIIYKEKTRMILYFINVIISFAISGAIIISFKRVIENYENTLITQKNKIETINQEITDSLNYAKKIQEALLPSGEYASCILNEHFVLFKPKDIVSGDFYWGTRVNEWLIVTVADCTGHGVPGAFMSMLGVSFLNEIVRKKEVKKASEVLDYLRDSIIDALQQKGNVGEQQDGMDMALVVLNKNTNELQFAGAKNPLFIISSNAPNEIQVVKGDNMPVGIYGKLKSFKNNEFKMNTGDSVYLFTDGIVDQFGGEKRKKFLTKRLKESILKISHMPMSEQGENLNNIFETWKGDNLQTDDVTIIGFKI